MQLRELSSSHVIEDVVDLSIITPEIAQIVVTALCHLSLTVLIEVVVLSEMVGGKSITIDRIRKALIGKTLDFSPNSQ